MRNTLLCFSLLLCSWTTYAFSTNNNTTNPVTNFQLLTIPLESGGMVTVRADSQSGKAWYRKDLRWVATVDSAPIPRSTYIFKSIAYKLKGWNLTRMDVNSGQTWILIGNKWQRIRDY